jgi:hypothetical protein
MCLTPNIVNLLEAEANPDIGMIVDAPHAGAPLIIAFAYVD